MSTQDTRFIFHSPTLDKTSGKAEFRYSLHTPTRDYSFTEVVTFPTETASFTHFSESLLQKALNNYALMAGISYWKTTCAKTIELPEEMALTKKQAEFWNTVYTKGLGEFFYTNQLDYHNLVNFPYREGEAGQPEHVHLQERSLVFFGGGKDSVVSVELMKKYKKDFTLFMVNESDIQTHSANITGKSSLVLKRTVDARLIELNNEEGIYNGHVPISAIWAFLGVLAGILFDYKYLIVSNEQSANYGNVSYLGEEINHQWSKSEEFEMLFQSYVSENISPDVTYFSLLRSLHEIKIAELFALYPEYFPYFSSCNRNFKITDPLTEKKWCGECAKCLFVFIMLSAFLKKDELLKIFGENLYQKESLLPLLQQLAGTSTFKPFECVGTPEETLLGLEKASEKGEYEEDFLMQYAKKQLLPIIKNRDTLKELLLVKPSAGSLPAAFSPMLVL